MAVLAGVLSSLRERIEARPAAEAAVLPGAVTALVAAVVLAGGVIGLLARLGPVSATPATAAWWLPLPAGRRGLLRGELRKVTGVAVLAALAVALPVLLAGPGAPTTTGVLLGLVGAALLAVTVVGGLVVLQAAGRTGWVSTVAGAVAAVAVVVPAVVATVAGVLGDDVADGTVRLSLPGGRVTALGAVGVLAVLAVLALLAAERRLGRLPAGALRARGETAQYASASAISLDTRELGRALGTVVRPPRRPRSWRWVTSPERAVVAADLAVLGRSPWRWGQLAVGAALPVLAARTRGLGNLPALVAVAVLLGWGLAAVALGEPSRRAHASPAADRALPLAARAVVQARAVVPTAVLAVVCGVSLLLVGQGTAEPLTWLALGVAAAPAWAGAAVRGGYRPELDWSGPVVSSPVGALPSGVGAGLVRGPDLGVLGTAPVAVALLLGEAPAELVAAQLVWSLALAALAIAFARSRS